MSTQNRAGTFTGAPVPRQSHRARRITLRVLSGAGIIVGGTLLTAFGIAQRRAHTQYTIPEHTLAVPTDQEAINRGARLAQVRFCAECHGEGLTGRIMAEAPALGRLAPSNLTNGRMPEALTDQEWERAVRHGVRADGSPLRIMPSHEFAQITDEDLAAIVAYARQLPASATPVPPTTLGPLILALDVAGQVDAYPASLIDHTAPHVERLTEAPTAAYGKYLASTCTGCHGPGLSGGKMPGTPPDFPAAANITPSGIGHYSLADFTRLLRSGVRPDGTPVNSGMPWKFTQSLNDTEIAALYAYLKTVAPREFGNR
jgi:mono/diheme cytochrome c family protein